MSINNTSYSCHHGCRKIVESFCQSYGVHIMHASVGVDTHTHTHTHTHIHIHTCIHTHTHTHTWIHTHTYMYMHTHAYVPSHTHNTHTHTNFLDKSNLKKPGMCLWPACTWLLQNTYVNCYL